jgi:hypothetical protein
MAAEAEELLRRPLDGNCKTCLTRIGLLMEGLGQQEVLCPSALPAPAGSMAKNGYYMDSGELSVNRVFHEYRHDASDVNRKFYMQEPAWLDHSSWIL